MKGSLADARAYALKLLSYRSRSRKELIDRLKRKGCADKEINGTVRFLEDTGLISDEALALELLRYSTEKKLLGGKGLEALLSRRGLDKKLINKTLAYHTRDMEEESAGRLVEKKLRSLKSYPEDVVKRRLYGMLQRRGFSMEVINRVLDVRG